MLFSFCLHLGCMEFKFLSPEDAEEVSEYVHPIWVDTYAPIVPGGRERAERIFNEWVGPEKIRHDMANGHFFAYVMDGDQRVGLISAGVEGTDLEVSKLYIAPEFRHRNYGGDALEFMLEYGKEKGCKRAILEVNPRNEAALSLYRNHGFRPEGQKQHDVGYTQLMIAFL